MNMYNLPMKLSQIGEFRLIEIIIEFLNQSGVSDTPEHDVLIGVGDDAAAWRSQGSPQLGTTDILVQDVHFSLDTITWWELGWKALAVNISDIAAMGGIPKHALVSLGLPSDTEVEQVIELYQGMAEIAKKLNLSISGGDVIKAPLVIISPSVVGVAGSNILTRSSALRGDLIAVTGYLGSSAAGLRMLKAGLELDEETASYLRQAHLCPFPRVREGQVLAQHGVRAAIDVSDGLVADLGKICQASGVGARVRTDKVPVHPLVQAAFKQDSLRLALSGGEDYELLFTARGDAIERAKPLMSTPVTIIGEIVDDAGQVTLLDEQGKAMQSERGGWEHFRDERLA